MTLLPFTLEAWRSGLQPCTADGREVKQLTLFECRIGQPIYGVVEDVLCSWNNDGTYYRNREDSNLSLRLRPKTEKRWILVGRDRLGKEECVLIFKEAPKEVMIGEIARVEIEVPCP